MNCEFHKYHALGNDYIVLDPQTFEPVLEPGLIVSLCKRNFGLGSDGILWGPLLPAGRPFQRLAGEVRGEPGQAGECRAGLRIYNPDGSEAEKSGNGLRIFCRYMYDLGLAGTTPFQLLTLGGPVECQVLEGGSEVAVGMGTVSFDAADIPVSGFNGEVLQQTIEIEGRQLEFSAATVGNPHCVLVVEKASAEEILRRGPKLENHPLFPNRTNVQMLEVKDRKNLKIEIWERGAGYTLASGSSACACAAVAHRLGLCDESVRVHMPGGELEITVDDSQYVQMRGAVAGVAAGKFLEDVLRAGKASP